MKVYAKNALVLVCGTAAAILIAGTASVTVSRQANATPQYATQLESLVDNVTRTRPAAASSRRPVKNSKRMATNSVKLPGKYMAVCQ